MSFEWSVKTENETEIIVESSTSDTDTVSFLTINDDRGRIYRCIANNSVGIGTMCSIEITGKRVEFSICFHIKIKKKNHFIL